MTRAADRILWPSLSLATLVYVAWGVAPRAGLFTTVLSPKRLVAAAAIAKLTLLALGFLWSWKSRNSLDATNPVRPAWSLLAAGMLANFGGQAGLAPFQLSGRPTPFPSLADVFYIAAYPLLGLALLRFVQAYEEVGYPIGTKAERRTLIAITTAVCAVLSVVVLRPVVQAELPPLDKALSAAYPLLDMALLVPLALLLRTTWHFRGGSVGTAWVIVLSGFVFVCAGDVLFAYFTALGATGLDPFVHAAYIVAYGLIAAGVRRHLALVAS